MRVQFTVLPDLLHPVASAAWAFFRSNRGAAKLQVERPLPKINCYVPTIWGIMPTGRIIAVEITDVSLPVGFSEFIHACRNAHLPVQLYVAMPSNAQVEHRDSNRRLSSEQKLGFLLVDGQRNCEVDREALSLSLAGARAISLPHFPARFREPLAEAQATYLNGNANKGVSQIWDQVELVTRAVAKETSTRGWWKNPPAPGFDFAGFNWYPLMDKLHTELDYGQAKTVCPEMKLQLIAKIMGASGDRNLSAHEPKTFAARALRDQRLRTLFESAADLLYDVLAAARPLKIKY